MQFATDSNDRPLISGDPNQGALPVVPGLAVWPTAAVRAAVAIVGQADSLVVAVREDASTSGAPRTPPPS